ncbi:Guanine nucleotide exchange factor subunit RIC1 [Fulvia fulva]|nr:Guanine nucleotide exchange factor subunit RIC1 [Fulvia fulva]WPV09423.1 Guanine nucleotide exchange factor subunit RIC1 [Fulvia fulva]WPV24279.1 Guanine nucleotide exchange factor subunit RIC1 [Fulvia fulva]
MYWPIGAPDVFSLQKQAIPHASLTCSHDGLEGEGDVEAGHSAGSQRGASGNGRQDQDKARGAAALADGEILDAKISRGGSVFITITRSSLVIWQTKPTVALAGVVRSGPSIKSYGPNVALLLRPDALIIVVQTALGYLITYSLATGPAARVYQTVLPDSTKHQRRTSTDGYTNFRRASAAPSGLGPAENDGMREVNVRFRMVMRIDAGISRALALEDELIVATQKPAALQCIRWVAENGVSQTSTELVSRMQWVGKKVIVIEMLHDRPMNLATWITSDGRAYAVQRRKSRSSEIDDPKSLFQGFCFREPETDDVAATKTAINARFSLIAVGCTNGSIDIYTVKDYTGNIPLSHKVRLPVGLATTGPLTSLAYSPDGYCLFAAYEHGWALWTVYGKPCANTFGADRPQTESNDEKWLLGIRNAFWVGGGSELALLPIGDNRLWLIDIARNAVTGCFSSANVSRGLLQSSDSVMLYKGHEVADTTSLPLESSLWQSVQIPNHYLMSQWPIKLAVLSPDGKYVAVAGRRGLAHYSVASGRWRTFEDPQAEQEFAVRGGMCWYQHILIAAVEVGNRHELRVYSRDKALEYPQVQHVEALSAPAISTTVSGADSLLVYTYENTLLHYVIVIGSSSARLVQVGQIGFHGIIRAPPRVRAISWILPEDQLEHGDPSQDVATASVLFLVDGKLVLLQPSTNELGELKYDMRVIAHNVEYYMLLRDSPTATAALKGSQATSVTPPIDGLSLNGHLGHSLRDSLWYFDGTGFHVWSDVQDVLTCAPNELGRDLPSAVTIPLDFSPVSALVGSGTVAGIESDLVQRRDVNFSFFRHAPRSQLFLPQLLRYHLTEFNSPAALHLSSSYQHLPYFSHALEVLLHDVLDMEVDNRPSPPETALLPTVLSFLSSFDSYLDVVVNCTRKTELRSWETLFSYLPPVIELFEQALGQGRLNTAAGYLLVLHAFEQDSFQIHEFAQLLRRAANEQDWDLCKELARFLVGIDASGHTLQSALTEAGLMDRQNGPFASVNGALEGSKTSFTLTSQKASDVAATSGRVDMSHTNGSSSHAMPDYFSIGGRNSIAVNLEAEATTPES